MPLSRSSKTSHQARQTAPQTSVRSKATKGAIHKARSLNKQATKRSPATKKRPSTKRGPRFSAKTADKHELYQLSVQDAAFEVQFITRVFRKLRGRKPLTIREDFCGTALFCAEWVKSDQSRYATGLDIDAAVLQWGRENNLAPLGPAQERIRLLQQDVLDAAPGLFDVGLAFNFSYWCFKDRTTLLRYFRRMRAALVQDGVFFLDAYGGYESHEPDLEEPRKIPGGFTYIWHQDVVDPINNHVINHIHFEFRDKTKLRKAFTYDWRLWSLPEIHELLLEAGFSKVTVYWEDADEDGEGTGVYRPKKAVTNEAGWIAYLLAEV